MKRRAALPKQPAAKRQRVTANQLAVTQTIVKREVARTKDILYTDFSRSTTNVTSTGAIDSGLQSLNRGDTGHNTFSGNKIYPKGLTFRYCLNTNQTFNRVRVMVFQWMDSVTPAISGVLETNANPLATIAPVLITNRSYIRVLYDKTHMLAPTAGGDTTPVGLGVATEKVFIPGSRIRPIRFNQSSNVVQDGNIYVLYISDDALTSYPIIDYWFRLSFTD